MKILKISYINFRNLKDKNINLSPGINLFVGKNGQGKTSIAEAMYFAATGKSFRTSKYSEIIKYNRLKSGCYIEYQDNLSDKSLSIKFNLEKKIYIYNKKNISYEDYYGKLNVVSFIPEDIELIVGSPSVRRRFFNSEISQSNENYFYNIRQYNKLLKLRNKYLKSRNLKDDMYHIYEQEFIKYGSLIIQKRVEYVKNISILLNLNYRKLFDDKKELNLNYSCFLGDIKKLELHEIQKKFKESIIKNYNREMKYGYSFVGPQKDDFVFFLNEKEAKSFSSQGEKKSIVFSLKLAELDMILKEKRENPVFIIDDLSSYFDKIRKDNIINFLVRRNIQVMITSTEKFKINSKNFNVCEGDVCYEDN
ncbi:DNA replication/repair protein RecF [Fusobacterium sp. MFO224]|uniref:DNA replication/repair protein RecF n=1 Tax=Fusobacterium sp. MFO224 TaxID=3378070 RepID=UPI003852A6F9